MSKERQLAKRLAKLIPVEGGSDVTFSLGSSGIKDPAQALQATLTLVLFKKAEDGKAPQIHKRITIAGVGADATSAQNQALDLALSLSGV